MDTNRYPPLRFRLALVWILLAILFVAGISIALYLNFRAELYNSLRHRLENITTLAALQQDGDAFSKVEAEGDPYFNQIQAQNLKIRRSDPELRFVYTMRRDTEGIYFVVDGGLPSEEGYSPFGMRYFEPGPALEENFDRMSGTLLEPDFYTDEYGTFLSGYAPILNSRGQQVGVIGVDITANTILAQERAYLVQIATIDLIALLLIVIAGFLAANYLAKPIVHLRDAANRISQGEFSHRITEIPSARELAELAVDFNTMTANLSGLITDLELRVAERTEDLTRKSDQLRSASYIARQSAEVQDLHALINTVVNLVTDQFGYYHTGIYLINEAGAEVSLMAASSDGGKRMIEKGHAHKIGAQGIVGSVAAEKKSRVTLDGDAGAAAFNNPDLPQTRSAIALPLLARGRLLGVLDIQSNKPNDFTPQDMDVFQTLADQVAVAIEKAQLLDASQAAFSQLEALTTVRTRESWAQKLKEKERVVTYTPLGLRAEKISKIEPNALTVPIVLRGIQIGTISMARKGNAGWSKQDEDTIREVATQTGLAVDNIRLLEEATERARQEQTVGELAFRFSQALDMDSLLQTAARELGQLPGIEETTVFIGQPGEAEDQVGTGGRQKSARRNGS
ncbi:MAG: GAF domain-containing protein [Anaerolineales bacterium]|nr:GAF domain-containing protein [Anaerolineales bacterium]